VVSFNLDEYYPLSKEDVQSYHYFMHTHLFDYVDIKPENIHIPTGEVEVGKSENFVLNMKKDKGSGGIDLQILGIGRTGHIGFNEPGSHKILNTNHYPRSSYALRCSSIFSGDRKCSS